MSAEDVLARHVEYGHDHRCHIDGNPMPCDAVLMARALAESEKRVDRLQDVFRREASAALVREVALEDALRKYGRHLRGCSALMPTDAQYCTCGLLDAKDARAALSEPETPRPLRGQTHTGRDGGVEVDAVAWEDGTFTIAEVRGLSEPETPR